MQHAPGMTADEIGKRARTIAGAAQTAGWNTAIIDGSSTVGGGSAPGAELPTRLLRLERDGLTAPDIEQHLRSLEPPVIARIHDGHVVLDLRTVSPDQDQRLSALLTHHEPKAT